MASPIARRDFCLKAVYLYKWNTENAGPVLNTYQ